MAWERGYYYQVRREGGSVVREYVGKGVLGEWASLLDEFERSGRELDALVLRLAKAELVAHDRDLNELAEWTDLAARAALLAAGFHQHKRGEWRKRRGRAHVPES